MEHNIVVHTLVYWCYKDTFNILTKLPLKSRAALPVYVYGVKELIQFQWWLNEYLNEICRYVKPTFMAMFFFL